jgi:LCP family protein required for cell wall assembly
MRPPAGPQRGRAPGPGVGYGRVRSGSGRLYLALALTITLLVGLVAAGGYLLYRRWDGAFSRGDLLAPDARAGRHGPVTGPLNLLLIGSDYRDRSPTDGERSDTIIIAHVSRGLDRVQLVSIPRDLLVTIPPDPGNGYQGATTKINAAFDAGHGGAGGIQLLSRTLSQLTGVRFDGAVAIRFDGLTRAVDLLGGVRMCVDVRTVSVHTHRVFNVGCRQMSSEQVLDYLRQRQFADGDYTRQRHQQQFLKAVLDRARGSGLVTDPVRLDRFLRAVGGAMTVDTGDASVADAAFALRGLPASSLSGFKIPSSPRVIGGTSYVVAGPDAQGLYDALGDDTVATWARAHPQWVNPL